MRLKTHIYRLHNSFVFRIAHGSRSSIDTFFVRLQADGLEGVGEATPVPYYGMTPQKMEELLEMHRERIETAVWTSPEDLWQQLDLFLHENRFAQCALDIAAHDLFAQKQGKPLYASWGLSLDTVPLSNYTIGIDEIDQMVQKMKEVDFPIYKIKLGTENDLAIVEALRKHSKAVFRVDANCSWTVEQTIEYAPELKKLGVEFIEQPLPANQMAEMEEVFAKSVLPVIADESCIQEQDVLACVGKFHGVNIKLAKCGGLTPARRMIAQAKDFGMKTMCGCMTESSVGISAIAQLLPLLDYVDMDGALLIANDPASGVRVEKGAVIFPERPGIGAILPDLEGV